MIDGPTSCRATLELPEEVRFLACSLAIDTDDHLASSHLSILARVRTRFGRFAWDETSSSASLTGKGLRHLTSPTALCALAHLSTHPLSIELLMCSLSTTFFIIPHRYILSIPFSSNFAAISCLLRKFMLSSLRYDAEHKKNREATVPLFDAIMLFH